MPNLDPTSDPQPIQFQFKGSAREYFSIWIVNVALTIITLGIYSAWAKVRTQQYFYGNTYLDNSSFRYLASPKQILKGRMIAVSLFVAYYFSGLISPTASVVALIALMLLLPYILTASMAFRARNTAWRHVRLAFDRQFKRAYLIAAIPLLLITANSIITLLFLDPKTLATQDAVPWQTIALIASVPVLLVLIYPWLDFAINQFRVKHTAFGDAPLQFSASSGQFYWVYLSALLAFILCITMLIGISATIGVLFFDANIPWMPFLDSASPIQVSGIPGLILFTSFGLIYFFAAAYIQTKRSNLILNQTQIEAHQLQSQLSVWYMWFLFSSNTLAIVLSLGLLIPWTKIRTARYRALCTTLIPAGDLESFSNTQRQQQSALGEEMGELFDMDVGF